MRNIFTYLSITLLCLVTSIVFSEHSEFSNNGGHSAWVRSYNSNTHAGKKYTDKYYQNASDSEGPFSASTSTETTRVSTPGLLHCYASWSCKAQVYCNHYFYDGYYAVSASIVVDGDTKDSHRGNADYHGYMPSFQGVFDDYAKAYYSENDTGPNASYPHPSITASDCSVSGTISGAPADCYYPYQGAWSHIPW
ncbi:MAG: hypothetical protein OXI67_21720 [Candidatus Poribacteria bacterium]|nr:hypothetical protein [Candidatus Poribacteria bacterium]